MEQEEEDDEEDEEVDEEDENELEFGLEEEEEDDYWDSQCFIGLQALHHQTTTCGRTSVYLFPFFVHCIT